MRYLIAAAIVLACSIDAHAQVTCSTVGTYTYCSNGLTAQQYGNNTYFNNGVVAQPFGNNTYYTAPTMRYPQQPIAPLYQSPYRR